MFHTLSACLPIEHQKNMSAVILMMIGAFIHDSCADTVQCYSCSERKPGGFCDDPFVAAKAQKVNCNMDDLKRCVTGKLTKTNGGKHI